jgi:hypothetical protein
MSFRRQTRQQQKGAKDHPPPKEKGIPTARVTPVPGKTTPVPGKTTPPPAEATAHTGPVPPVEDKKEAAPEDMSPPVLSQVRVDTGGQTGYLTGGSQEYLQEEGVRDDPVVYDDGGEARSRLVLHAVLAAACLGLLAFVAYDLEVQ